MSSIAELAIRIDSSSAKVAANDMDRLTVAGGKTERAVSSMAKEARQAGGATGQLAGALSMATKAAGIFGLAIGAAKLAAMGKDAVMLAARYETLGVSMRIAGNNAGYTSAQMETFTAQLRKSGISMLQSRDAVIQLATANIDLARASELGRAAQDLAVVANTNSSEAMGRLVYGIKSAQVEVLRTMGLNVSFEAGYKKLSAALGVTTNDLTEQQKTLSRTNTVLEAATAYTGIYEESMTTAGKAMGSLTRYWEDFKVKAGDAFLPMLATAVFGVTEALKEAQLAVDELGRSELIQAIGVGLGGAFKAVEIALTGLVYMAGQALRVMGALAAVAANPLKAPAVWGSFSTDYMAASRSYTGRLNNQLGFTKAPAGGSGVSEADRIAQGEARRKALEAEAAALAKLEKAEEAAKEAAKARGAAIRAAAAEVARATNAAQDYIARLREEREAVGATDADLRGLETRRAIAAAPEQYRDAIRANAAALTEEAQAAKAAAFALEQRNEQMTKGYMDNWLKAVGAVGVKAANDNVSVQALPNAPQLETKTERLLNAYDQAADTLFDMAWSLRVGDWSGFIRAIGAARDTLKNWKTMSTEGKIGAVAGLASAAGQIIGGKAGAALSGAAGGAMAGAAFGVPGAIIGGLIGGIGGLIGASKAAKRALEEQKKAQDDLNRAATKQGFDLWIEVLKAMGHATSAQGVERDQMLAGIDPRNKDMALRLFALQDANAAQDMNLRLLQAQGKETEALALTRKIELDATTDLLKPILLAVYAAEDLAAAEVKLTEAREAATARAAVMTDLSVGAWQTAVSAVNDARSSLSAAYERERGELQATKDKFLGLASGLREFRLSLGGANAAGGNFFAAAAKAQMGDTDALAELPGLGAKQIELIKANAKTDLEAARGIAQVRNAVLSAEGTALRHANIAAESLTALEQQVAGLGLLNSSVMDVSGHIAVLSGTISQAFKLGQVMDPKWGAVQNVRVNQDLAAKTGFSGNFGGGGFQNWILSQDEAVKVIARMTLEAAGQSDRIAFANGGMHSGGLRLVGERGPELEVTGPSRIYSASQTKAMLGGDNSEVVAELRAMRQENRAMAAKVSSLESIMQNVTEGGRAMLTEAA
jgi:hypothetical protein